MSPGERAVDTDPLTLEHGKYFSTFIVKEWDYGVAKFPKIGDSLPRTPMNHHAKFYAASFIPGGEIRNVQSDKFTNKQTNKQ